jgi:hypothetical protein
MPIRPTTCMGCGRDAHGATPCEATSLPLAQPIPQLAAVFGSPCSCLPESLDDAWRPCAVCGLVQAPGKIFCGYCGHRWVVDPAG